MEYILFVYQYQLVATEPLHFAKYIFSEYFYKRQNGAMLLKQRASHYTPTSSVNQVLEDNTKLDLFIKPIDIAS